MKRYRRVVALERVAPRDPRDRSAGRARHARDPVSEEHRRDQECDFSGPSVEALISLTVSTSPGRTAGNMLVPVTRSRSSPNRRSSSVASPAAYGVSVGRRGSCSVRRLKKHWNWVI